MSSETDIKKALDLLQKAEASLRAARALLGVSESVDSSTQNSTSHLEETKHYLEEDNQVIEGYFDGRDMIGPDEKRYSVPANYASKSKLIQGDRLKLTITPNGNFIYKQIEPKARKITRGTLVREDGEYRVLANGKAYKVLMASVTYYRGNTGDDVSLIVPEDEEAEWGAIEAIIPQINPPTPSHHSGDFF